RYALELPLDRPPPERRVDAIVEVDAHARGPQLARQRRCSLAGATLVAHEQDRDLDGREAGRDAQAGVVAVAHDQRADEPGGEPPRRLPGMLLLAGLIEELGVEDSGEVLAQLVARAHLQRLAVAHHRLAGVAGVGARE